VVCGFLIITAVEADRCSPLLDAPRGPGGDIFFLTYTLAWTRTR